MHAVKTEKTSKLTLAVGSFILALLILTLLMWVMGYSPVACYSALFAGMFGNWDNIAATLGTSTPLILAGLAMAVASRSGTFNIGVEGQIIGGAFAAALVGIYVKGLPFYVHIPLCFLGAAVVGGLWGALVAWLKRILGVSELIIAIMLNYIMSYLIDYLLVYHFAVEGMVVRTEYIQPSATLTPLAPLSRLNMGFFLALVLAAFVWWLLYKTVLGYEMRACGYNVHAAETAGINTRVISLLSMFISGAIAGTAGAIEVMGVHNYYIAEMTTGYGFTGIAVGIMGNSTPLGTLVSGLIFGALRAGSTNMSRLTTAPKEFISILQALVIVFVATPRIIQSCIPRGRKKSGRKKKGGAQ